MPAGDPTSVRAGQSLTVQLLFDGRPVADAAVTAVSAAEGESVTKRTDQNGRVTLTLDRAGSWLIKTVHMTRLPSGSTEDWESFWVTLDLHTSPS